MLAILGVFLLLLLPSQLSTSNKRVSFIDIYLIFCLYFDAMRVFAGNQIVYFSYLQAAIFIIFAMNYMLTRMVRLSKNTQVLLFFNLAFIFWVLSSYLLKGQSLNIALRTWSLYFFPMLIMPIAFHYYSHEGDIRNLLKYSGYFIVGWVLFVLFFTVLQIDTVYRGGHLGSQSFGLSIFYFGDMGARGAISYIGIALLLCPLIIEHSSLGMKRILYISISFIVVLLLIALKRFSLIAIILGFTNMLISTKIQFKRKIFMTSGIFLLVIPYFMLFDLGTLISRSYEYRQGEQKISVEAIEGDLRFDEPQYAMEYLGTLGFDKVIFGAQTDVVIDIESDEHYVKGRSVHNQYAQYLLLFGFLGLVLYLLIYYNIYNITRRLKNQIKTRAGYNNLFWISAQNIILVFVLGGVAGGHSHYTYKAIVFLFCGAIAGHFQKQQGSLYNVP